MTGSSLSALNAGGNHTIEKDDGGLSLSSSCFCRAFLVIVKMGEGSQTTTLSKILLRASFFPFKYEDVIFTYSAH